jgi:hypothetical protein
MTDFTDEVRKIGKRLKPRGRATDGRSALYHWLFQRADLFRRLLDDSHPSWESVAAALANQGLTNGRGKPLDAERVRKIWFNVRRAKGWLTSRPAPVQTPAPSPLPRAPARPPIAPPLPDFLSDFGDDDDFELKTINPRKP